MFLKRMHVLKGWNSHKLTNLRKGVTFRNYLHKGVCFVTIYAGVTFCMEAANDNGEKAWAAIAIGDTVLTWKVPPVALAILADVEGAAFSIGETRHIESRLSHWRDTFTLQLHCCPGSDLHVTGYSLPKVSHSSV